MPDIKAFLRPLEAAWAAGGVELEARRKQQEPMLQGRTCERPGARVLVVVGASHKPWFDHWLGQLQGVDIVDVAGVLK